MFVTHVCSVKKIAKKNRPPKENGSYSQYERSSGYHKWISCNDLCILLQYQNVISRRDLIQSQIINMFAGSLIAQLNRPQYAAIKINNFHYRISIICKTIMSKNVGTYDWIWCHNYTCQFIRCSILQPV